MAKIEAKWQDLVNALEAYSRVSIMNDGPELVALRAVIYNNKLKYSDRWKHCPSTHCERRGECCSPHDCCLAAVEE